MILTGAVQQERFKEHKSRGHKDQRPLLNGEQWAWCCWLSQICNCDRLWSIVINCDYANYVIATILVITTHPPGGNSIPLGVLAKLQHRSSRRRGRSDESSHQHLPCSLRKLYGCFCYLGPCQPTGIREKSKWTSVGPVYAFTQTRLIPIQELITCRASSAWSTSKTQPWPVESRLEPLLIWFSLHWVPSSWAVFQVHFTHFFLEDSRN